MVFGLYLLLVFSINYNMGHKNEHFWHILILYFGKGKKASKTHKYFMLMNA